MDDTRELRPTIEQLLSSTVAEHAQTLVAHATKAGMDIVARAQLAGNIAGQTLALMIADAWMCGYLHRINEEDNRGD